MSHRKNISNVEAVNCEKYLNRLVKDRSLTRKPATGLYQEKFSTLSKQPTVTSSSLRAKPKTQQNRQPSPVTTPRLAKSPSPDRAKEALSTDNNPKDSPRSARHRHRSVSSCTSDREPWGQLLLSNKSREKISSFSNFDPLRTLHFLSKELFFRLQTVLPEEHDVHQMVTDIQYALKRIPPEIASTIHLNSEFINFKTSSKSLKYGDDAPERLSPKPIMTSKSCQTPPTLYQEDTEKFQKIMDENAQKLEISCKQLENVCLTLQTEKEMTERELEQTKQNMDMLIRRIKELESEFDPSTNKKITQLEQENEKLRKQLDKTVKDLENNSSVNHLKKLIEELRIEKNNSDQACARLEYDMTLLSMEKEKFVTMLAVRDREIKEIQEEMSRIQEQVSKELKRLNGEILSRASSLSKLSSAKSSEIMPENKDKSGIGDVAPNPAPESLMRDSVNIVKENSCGDAEAAGVMQENNQQSVLERIAQMRTGGYEFRLPFNKDQDTVLEELLNEMIPPPNKLLSK